MTREPSRRLVSLMLTAVLTTLTGLGQESRPSPAESPLAPTTSTAPATTQTRPAVNPLLTPARMMAFFESAAKEGRWEDAQRCLNFERIDPDIVKERGPDYARQLAEILARLADEGLYDPAALPDDPTAESQTIGRDPLILILQRYAYPVEGAGEEEGEAVERRWQFAASTVQDTPDLHANLDTLLARARQKAATVAEERLPPGDPLRSPYHTVQHFLVSVAGVKTDPQAYSEAMRCLDFSQVEATDFETRTTYVDGLSALLKYLHETGEFDREKLPRSPSPETDTCPIGNDPFQLILVRGTDGRWRFRARTVKGIPAMVKKLEALRTQQVGGEAQTGTAGAAPPAAPPEIFLDTSSPQATMNLFLTAMTRQDLKTAVTCFDLSQLTPGERSQAPLLAGKLWMILNRHKVVVLQEIPNDPEYPTPYPVLKHAEGQIWIGRQRSGPRAGEWLFTSASVREIDHLYNVFEARPVLPELRQARITFRALPSLYVREYVVPAELKRPLGPLQVWQWVGLVLVAAFGLIIRWLSNLVLPRVGRRLLSTETAEIMPQVAQRSFGPLATLLMLVAWWMGLQLLDLGADLLGTLWWVLRVVMALAGMFAFYRLTDVVMGYFASRASQSVSRLDDVLVPLLQKTLKVVIVAVGLIFVAMSLGFEITPLFAGLGIGTFAFAFAAQDTLKNFFGSVNVVLDRPFQVGDWVKIGDVEGTVESVGLRSSRIRTFYNSQVTVPNSELMTARIDNLGRRRYRRISCMISVTYDTSPERLEAFCEGIRALIRQHPYTRKDYYHCWVNEFAASSINILLYCFHETPDWGTELRERHRLFLDIIRLANRLGVEFAFPTQTVHLHHESSPPAVPPPPPPDVPPEPTEAMRLGAEEAARLVREAFGDKVEKPPPVKY